MDLKWETPPSPRTTSQKTSEIADELRSNPTNWAVIAKKDTVNQAGSLASSIKKGTRAGFGPAGSFEATTRTVDGKGVVYARYIGVR